MQDRPTGEVHPLALSVLEARGHDVSALRSKSWYEFEQPGAPVLDFVFTVCDNAAAAECPVWPQQPISAHWSLADPAAFEGSDAEWLEFFNRTYQELERRIGNFTKLSIESLDRATLEARLDEIGKTSAGRLSHSFSAS